jgi:hypothetical protein
MIAVGLLGLAALAVAVVYGTDMFFAVVGRRALARVSDAAVVETMGRLHEVGDRRMPVFGVLGLVTTLVGALTATGSGRLWALGALMAQLAWLPIYLRVAAPINARLTRAARAAESPAEGRAWQDQWDGVIWPRAALMGVALIALLVALVKVA